MKIRAAAVVVVVVVVVAVVVVVVVAAVVVVVVAVVALISAMIIITKILRDVRAILQVPAYMKLKTPNPSLGMVIIWVIPPPSNCP